jgi:hypothetical protein
MERCEPRARAQPPFEGEGHGVPWVLIARHVTGGDDPVRLQEGEANSGPVGCTDDANGLCGRRASRVAQGEGASGATLVIVRPTTNTVPAPITLYQRKWVAVKAATVPTTVMPANNP